MADKEFIIFLCGQMQRIVCGDEPDVELIEKELKIRDINIDDVFTY